jgi:hypothetical protein
VIVMVAVTPPPTGASHPFMHRNKTPGAACGAGGFAL